MNQWSQSSGEACDIAKRQLVLQQLINTLVILFKAPEELCFWGSAQLWVDTNMRVYLYVDFINSLAVQKVSCIEILEWLDLNAPPVLSIL